MPSTLGSGPALRKDTHHLTFSLHQPKKLTMAEGLRGSLSGPCPLSTGPLHPDSKGRSYVQGTYLPGIAQGSLTSLNSLLRENHYPHFTEEETEGSEAL